MEAMIPIVLFFVIGGVIILRGPLGKAIADRVAGRSAGGHPGVERELSELHRRVAELEERVDFTERLLARARREAALPGAGNETG